MIKQQNIIKKKYYKITKTISIVVIINDKNIKWKGWEGW